MRFFRRLGNIVSAHMHELLEWCENPELLLQQAIRNMEEALRAALTGAARVVAHEHLLARQHAAAEAEAEKWRRRAADAVRSGDDDAARQALRRHHEGRQLLEALAAQRQDAETMGRRLRRQLETLRLRLHEARRQRDMLIARMRAAEARRRLCRTFSDLPLDTSGFHEFERMADKVQRAEAEADAVADLAGSPILSGMAEDDTGTAAWVEQELRGLKELA